MNAANRSTWTVTLVRNAYAKLQIVLHESTYVANLIAQINAQRRASYCPADKPAGAADYSGGIATRKIERIEYTGPFGESDVIGAVDDAAKRYSDIKARFDTLHSYPRDARHDIQTHGQVFQHLSVLEAGAGCPHLTESKITSHSEPDRIFKIRIDEQPDAASG
jgi:hypothetical protein